MMGWALQCKSVNFSDDGLGCAGEIRALLILAGPG